MADAAVLTRLSNLGITGTRANTLETTITAAQILSLSDSQVLLMVDGRESGVADTTSHLYPNGKLYPS